MAKEEKHEEGEGAAPKKKSKLPLIIILVVVLLGGGVGAFLMLGGEKKEGEAHEEEKPKVFKKAKLDTFVVNLSENKSFLKVGMQIEYDVEALERLMKEQGEAHGGGGAGGGEPAPDALPHGIIEKEPIVRDAVIRVLSSKRPEEVLTVEGKQTLKDELLEAINEVLEFSEPVVTNIYFTEFLIQ